MRSISNLHVTVGDQPILNGLTLDASAGEVHAVMGPNGSRLWYDGQLGVQP